MCEVICPHRDKCVDYGSKCGDCDNNQRRSYYRRRCDWAWYPCVTPGVTWVTYNIPSYYTYTSNHT